MNIKCVIPPADKPGPPAAFDISEITNESCFLAWNPPRDDGGSKVTNYIVEKRQTDKEEWVKLSATVKQTTFNACKLTPLKEYIFRVSAENQYGISQPAEHVPIIAKYSFGRSATGKHLYVVSSIYVSVCKNDICQVCLIAMLGSLTIRSKNGLCLCFRFSWLSNRSDSFRHCKGCCHSHMG